MNKEIESSVTKKGITRLCHFTPSRNLAHIAVGQVGILSTEALEQGERAIFNQTDVKRLDKHLNHICCSIEYPNAWYFDRARTQDEIFPDWVVLLIKPHYLWQDGTKFCPRNAAADYGRYIAEGKSAFESMFADEVLGTRMQVFKRSSKQSSACPTDQQAEVLVPDKILIGDIESIAVKTNEQGLAEQARLRLVGINPDNFKFVVAPHMFSKYELSHVIQNGLRPSEPSVAPLKRGE